jgi:hypothetical protein
MVNDKVVWAANLSVEKTAFVTAKAVIPLIPRSTIEPLLRVACRDVELKMGWGEGVGFGVGEGVGVGLGVLICVGFGLSIGIGVGLSVGFGVGAGFEVGVRLGVGVGVWVGVGVEVEVGVGIGVGEGVGVGWLVGGGVGEGLGVGEREGDGDWVGEGDGLGFAETMFGWIKLKETSNRETTANTAAPKKIFLNLSICDPFNCFYWKISSIFKTHFKPT